MTEEEIQHLLTDSPMSVIFGTGADYFETLSRDNILRQLSISTGLEVNADSAIRFRELRTVDLLSDIINGSGRADQPEMRLNSKDETIYLYYKKGW